MNFKGAAFTGQIKNELGHSWKTGNIIPDVSLKATFQHNIKVLNQEDKMAILHSQSKVFNSTNLWEKIA